MNDRKNKQFLIKMNHELDKDFEEAYSKYLKKTGKHITKSGFMREALNNYSMSVKAKEITYDDLYNESLAFIADFIKFLAEVKGYWLCQNGGKATVKNNQEAVMLKYFLSVISRVDDARLLSGNVYSFQTLISIERALFESAVDLTLLNRGPQIYFDKNIAWDRLTIIKYARSVSEYVKTFNTDLNDPKYSPLKIHVDHVSDTNKIDIEITQLKQKIDNKDPKTWTGLSSLKENAQEADKLKNYDFYKEYSFRYKLQCMDTHGSGTAGLGTTDPEYFKGRCFFSYLYIIMWATIAYYETYSFFKKINEDHLIKLTGLFYKHNLINQYPKINKLILKK